MAEKAQQEPTMEEILSSIRKIISDDGPPQDSPASDFESQTATFETEAGDPTDLNDLSFENDETFDVSMSGDEADVLEALTTEPETAFSEDMFDSDPATFKTTEDTFDELPPLDDLSSFEIDTPQDDGIVETASVEVIDPVVETEDEIDPIVDQVSEPIFATDTISDSEPIFEEEPRPMAASTLTDDKTAAAAVGSLSKLVSKVEVEEDPVESNTIEGMVREMLRPMLKEWLDENLADIVDKHVEAEVKRIANRAG